MGSCGTWPFGGDFVVEVLERFLVEDFDRATFDAFELAIGGTLSLHAEVKIQDRASGVVEHADDGAFHHRPVAASATAAITEELAVDDAHSLSSF